MESKEKEEDEEEKAKINEDAPGKSEQPSVLAVCNHTVLQDHILQKFSCPLTLHLAICVIAGS